jgi:hypothetical protein
MNPGIARAGEWVKDVRGRGGPGKFALASRAWSAKFTPAIEAKSFL